MHITLILFFCSLFATAQACPFCDSAVIERQFLMESDKLVVLLDIAPIVKGHLLIIPKRHVVKAHELTSEEWQELSEIMPRIVMLFKKALDTDQYIILEKNGPKAYQHIPHVHFHLLPIKSQVGLEIFQHTHKNLSNEEFESQLNAFRAHLHVQKK
jgi:diadenosine tetraphosphate (Ap4A) HIT family hydrolase